jgi:hypothetical protein
MRNDICDNVENAGGFPVSSPKRRIDICDKQQGERKMKARWNGWKQSGHWLLHPAYRGRGASGWRKNHVIDLELFESSASMVLELITEMTKKPWATDACVAGLVRALDDIHHHRAGKQGRAAAAPTNNNSPSSAQPILQPVAQATAGS